MRPPAAEIVFNQDFVIWILGPALLSLAVLVAGILLRPTRAATPLIVIGAGCLVLSGIWIGFAFWVDSVLGDT